MTTDDQYGEAEIHVSDVALAAAEDLAVNASPYELGGILVGWWEGDRLAVVEELLLVPDHTAGHAHYDRRHSAAQHVLDRHRQTHTDTRCGYIGEWHTHPAPHLPSATDRHALNDTVRQARAPVAMIVLAITGERQVAAHGLIGRPRRLRCVAIEITPVRRMPS